MVASPKRRQAGSGPFSWGRRWRRERLRLPYINGSTSWERPVKKGRSRLRWVGGGFLILFVLVWRSAPSLHELEARVQQGRFLYRAPSRGVLLRLRYRALLAHEDFDETLNCNPQEGPCGVSPYPTADIAAPAIDSISVAQFKANTHGLPVTPGGIYVMETVDVAGEPADLLEHAGKLSLVVNIAINTWDCKAELTRLIELYDKYKHKGFVVLGFPSEDFNGLIPWTDQNIYHFTNNVMSCKFPIFAKAPLNGNETHPVIRYLKEHLPGGSPDPETGQLSSDFEIRGPWTKFLVNRHGMPVKFYGGRNGCDGSDDTIEADIQMEIEKPQSLPFVGQGTKIASA